MSSEQKMITIGAVALLLAITSIGIVGCHETQETQREAIKAGYSQEPDHTASTHWIKK